MLILIWNVIILSKLPQKDCPRCGEILERLYHRERKNGKQCYIPIGYICPDCKENMIVIDKKELEN